MACNPSTGLWKKPGGKGSAQRPSTARFQVLPRMLMQRQPLRPPCECTLSTPLSSIRVFSRVHTRDESLARLIPSNIEEKVL
jgi:hypothetical protein